jgi:hypothetical protein
MVLKAAQKLASQAHLIQVFSAGQALPSATWGMTCTRGKNEGRSWHEYIKKPARVFKMFSLSLVGRPQCNATLFLSFIPGSSHPLWERKSHTLEDFVTQNHNPARNTNLWGNYLHKTHHYS